MSTSYDNPTACKETQSSVLASVWTKGGRDSRSSCSLYSTAVQQGARGSQYSELLAAQSLKDRIPICPKVIAPNLACQSRAGETRE